MEALSAEFAVMERLFSSALEAFVVEISTSLTKSLVYFLLTAGSLSNAATEMFPRDPMVLDRMSITELYKEKNSEPENEDASDEDEDEYEDVEQDDEEEEDGEDGSESSGDEDLEDDLVATGSGDDDDGDDDDEDGDDEDGDDEDDENEDDEDDDDDAILQPPSKKRK